MDEKNDINQELDKDERLGFREQVAIVRSGFAKGIKYDGCTAVPDFDFGFDCCGEHDYHYQMGDIPRSEADTRLRKCIADKGYPGLAVVYWLGVRVMAGGVWKRYRELQDDKTIDVDRNRSDAA